MTCATITTHHSRTAAPAFGHRQTIGFDAIRTWAKGKPRLTVIGTRSATAIADDRVATAFHEERLREALYLSCERAPEFGPQHRNLMKGPCQ